jgi:hypothetical protein
VQIRRIEARDEPRWRELFAQYTRFYEREPDEAITRHVWSRIMDPAAPVRGIVAEDAAQGVVGIANYLLHESTGSLMPVCYLQDLFVDPAVRGAEARRARSQGRSGFASASGIRASMKSASRVAPGGSMLLRTTITSSSCG